MIRALRLFGLALLSMATTASAAAPDNGAASPPYSQVFDVDVTQIAIPAYVEDEAKFAKEDPNLVDMLEFINTYVNVNIFPVGDDEHYGIGDYWMQAPKDQQGDCEDYAITKIFMLEKTDLNVVTDSRLTFVEVHITDDKGKPDQVGHAILAVHMPNGSVAYLDNMNQHLMTQAELEAEGYEFQHW